MSSFEAVVLVFGSPQSIASVNLRLPVSSSFVFDMKALEDILNLSPQLSDPCIKRYFLILLESIDEHLLTRLKSNHRIVSVYDRGTINHSNQNQMTNSYRQLTLDLTNDIIRFLTTEGEKQIKLERLSLVKIYYQQARILKEWSMSLFKAEPCHILLISLNSTKQNLDSTQQRLEQICTKLGYSSTIIRQLNDYIPSSDRHSSLLPYSQLLFNNEDLNYLCQLLKNVSSVRLYLYGNELDHLNQWSEIMIGNEDEMMNDEDNWSAFLENEPINNEVKWNFAFLFGQKWKISRVSPIQLNQISENPRFHSALRRSHLTFSQRQIEITAQIFDWYNKCIERQFIPIEPKLTKEQESMKSDQQREKLEHALLRKYSFRQLSLFDYRRFDSRKTNSVSFIWLDQMLNNCDSNFNEMIKPFEWIFFDELSDCISFIEKQLREQRYIFLVVSGSIGKDLFLSGLCSIQQIFATYIYCAQLNTHFNWTKEYSKIRGTFNDSNKLKQKITQDFIQLQNSLNINNTNWDIQLTTNHRNQVLEDTESLVPLPMSIYDPDEPHLFLSHQRTIDTLLCMPHTGQSKAEMIEEFRRIYSEDQSILTEIDNFEENYHSIGSVQWYTRDSFVWRTINQTLRSSDVDSMFKLRHILTDIYRHLTNCYREAYWSGFRPLSEVFYRGQLMSKKEFNYFKENQGNIISINTFLSTTASMQVALMYAGEYFDNSELTSIVFSIERDSAVQTRPYAKISHYSLFPDEEEVLFSMGSVFRIGNIRPMPNADRIWIIHLKMTDQNDYRFKETNS